MKSRRVSPTAASSDSKMKATWLPVSQPVGSQEKYNFLANLILTVHTNDYQGFQREGNDLIYTVRVSLLHSLTAQPVGVTTLDGRVLKVALDTIIR